MSNSYTQFCFVFNCPESPEEAAAVLDTWRNSPGEDGDLGFAWVIDRSELIIYSDETGDPEHVVKVLQDLMAYMNFDLLQGFEWATWNSSLRPGEFGGGCVAFNGTTDIWLYTDSKLKELQSMITKAP